MHALTATLLYVQDAIDLNAVKQAIARTPLPAGIVYAEAYNNELEEYADYPHEIVVGYNEASPETIEKYRVNLQQSLNVPVTHIDEMPELSDEF